jgi:hypothetical protein
MPTPSSATASSGCAVDGARGHRDGATRGEYFTAFEISWSSTCLSLSVRLHGNVFDVGSAMNR